MGIKVAATLDTEFKFNYTVSTVLAASFTLADEDLALWIGNAHPFSKSEELAALENCSAFIRENGTTTPTGTNESYAELGTNFKKDVNGAFDAAAALPEEAKVGIWYGPDFQALEDNSITPFVVQLIEHYVETTQASSD